MIEVSDETELASRYINTTDRHIFLTGKAGTGKTTFLKYIIDHTYKNTVVAAPTGIAAINAGGTTLHSLLQLPFGPFIPEDIPFVESDTLLNTPGSLRRGHRFNVRKRKLIKELELLIIDEVSMLRADLLDCIDHTLRYLRKNRVEPFGGLQMLFIGDLMQLPPVIKESESRHLAPYYSSPYFFEAHALRESPPIRIELKKIYRQKDQAFIDMLNRLRNNEQLAEDVDELNSHYVEGVNDKKMVGYIQLTTHNHKADLINNTELEKLNTNEKTFDVYIEGDFPEKLYPGDPVLRLKIGAQVMFIKNDPTGQGRFFNGRVGKVASLEEEIVVQCENGDEITVEPYRWENKRYVLNKSTNEVDEKHLGFYEQYPLKLAWAVTVHKSQGMTFDKAILDLSDSFAPGQLYVALSRLTSPKGLVLSSRIGGNIPPVVASLRHFSNSFESESTLVENLGNDQKSFFIQFSKQAFDLSNLLQMLRNHQATFDKNENRSLKQQYFPWTQAFIKKALPLKDTGHKFIRQVQHIASEDHYLPFLNERMTKAHDFFSNALSEMVDDLDEHKKSLNDKSKIKTYIKELNELKDFFVQQVWQILKLSMLVSRFADGKILTKEHLHQNRQYKKTTSTKYGGTKPTAEVSFELYKQGKSIEEIARERELVRGTIEGHLSKYVGQGAIDIEELVSKPRIETIKKAIDSGLKKIGEIKAALDSSFSYAEIKLVLGHLSKDGS